MYLSAERHILKESVLPSTSHSTPGTGINHLSRGRISSHSRALSQPCRMPSTQTILGRGCGHADAGLYTGMSQLNPKSPPEPAQSTTLPASLNASLLSPPPYPQQSPEPAPWSLTTRSSEADVNHVENPPIPATLTPHFLENQYIHAPFSESPGFSTATLRSWFPTADVTDMEPPLSSHTQGDSFAFLRYPGSLSQAAGHDTPTPQSTPPTSPESQPTQEHPTGKRHRHSVPKDPRAAKRLRTQRQGDDENLEALYKLLVPKSAGVVQKKDRLGMSTSPSFLLLPDGDDDDRVIVSTSLCEKVDADRRRFRTAINDLRADERLSVHFTLAAKRAHGKFLSL